MRFAVLLVVLGLCRRSVHGQNIAGIDLSGLGISLGDISIQGPLECESDSTVKGYSNLTQLAIDMIVTNIAFPQESTYTVCPNTTHSIKEEPDFAAPGEFPLVIPFDDITVNCGTDGSSKNNCVLTGGLVHALLGANNAAINGFTFEESTQVSVAAVAPDYTVTFNDCVFRQNKGLAILYSQRLFDNLMETLLKPDLVEKIIALAPDKEDPVFPPVIGAGMVVTFSNCIFLENELKYTVMFSRYATVNIDACRFEGNTPLAADIMLTMASSSEVKNSCFINEGPNQAFGNIFVSSNSTLVQEENYGEGTVGLFQCTDIFQEGEGQNCIDLPGAQCQDFNCDVFTAETCPLKEATTPSSEETVPSSGPMTEPAPAPAPTSDSGTKTTDTPETGDMTRPEIGYSPDSASAYTYNAMWNIFGFALSFLIALLGIN